MSRPRTSSEFRDAVAETFKKLKEQLKAEGKSPAREIADKLGVTKQTAYEYLRGQTVPGPDRLGKLLETWNLTFQYRGYQVDKDNFSPERSAVAASVTHQYQIKEDQPLRVALPRQDASLVLELDGQQLKVVIDLERSD